MESRYARNIPALTEAECRLLRKKRILVVGCGGLGGHILDGLARIGVGFLRVADGDVFEETNLNRQLLSRISLLGTSKAKAAAEHVRRINPDVIVDAVDTYMTVENVRSLVSGCDIVMDALDSIPARRLLADACSELGVPYVYGAIAGWVAQAALSMPGDGLIRTLYPDGIQVSDKSVLSFTPALCASMQVALCVKHLTGRPVVAGTVYYFDLLNQEFEAIPMV